MSRKADNYGPSPWVSDTHVGDLGGALAPYSSLARPFEEYLEDEKSLALSLSFR